MALIFQQLMTPDWLENKGQPIGGAKINTDENGAVLHLNQTGTGSHRNVLNVKLHDLMMTDKVPEMQRLLKGDLLTYSIEIAFNHVYRESNVVMPRVYVMLVDPRSKGTAAMGFRIEGNTSVYTTPKIGPYGAVKAGITASGDALVNVVPIESATERVTTTSKLFPSVFKILMRPGKSWGSCYAAIDSGHLHVADYQNQLFFQNSQVVLGLYSDDTQAADRYQLNYIDVSIYKEDLS